MTVLSQIDNTIQLRRLFFFLEFAGLAIYLKLVWRAMCSELFIFVNESLLGGGVE